MTRWLVLLAALLLAAVAGGCALRERPVAIWFKNTPQGWTPPARFAHCTPNGEVVIVNGQPDGRSVIRMDCRDAEETVYLDTLEPKRLVWREKWYRR